jgi:DNA-binding NtrC family response regulator
MINTKKATMKVCIEECQIGKEFQKLGEMLAPRKKPKFSPRENPLKERYKHITKEVLEKELATEKTYVEIENHLGIPRNCLRHHLKIHGIKGRRRTWKLHTLKPVTVAERYPHITKEMVQAEMDSDKSYRDIEKNLKIPKGSLKYHLNLHGIQGRGRGKGKGKKKKHVKKIYTMVDKYPHVTKELILTQLATGKTYSAIEKEIGIAPNTMHRHLKAHGIPQRTRGRNQKI